MKQIFLVSSISMMAVALLAPGLPLAAAQPFAGRWDLTVTTPKDTYPSWMEFTQSGGRPNVRIVGRVASVHPATDSKLEGSRLSFTTSEWFDGEIKVTWENDKFHGMGSIYGFLAPAVELAKRPGEWESYDVTLVGRTVTVVRNGQTTIDRQEIPGITGGAIDSREGEPGPLYIQGDHTGGMKYRNITISVPDR
jgi:hypothetical protein